MSRNERYFELWDSSKQDLCNHSLELEKELAKLKEENEKLKRENDNLKNQSYEATKRLGW